MGFLAVKKRRQADTRLSKMRASREVKKAMPKKELSIAVSNDIKVFTHLIR